MSTVLIKINVRGGILSPGDLRKILEVTRKCKCKDIHLGERQTLYIHIAKDCVRMVEEHFHDSHFDYEVENNEYPNIISSYVSEGVFTSYNNWVSEGVYRDILDSFAYRPLLKINVVDNTQGLVPLFTGNLNFISSESPNFWYLFLRRKSEHTLECWPQLIYSSEISTLSETLESLLFSGQRFTVGELAEKVSEAHKLITIERETDLMPTRMRLPYYEGLNKSGDDNYWLGIYRRNNDFSIDFLDSLCKLCFHTKVGLIQLTTWKSMLIKGIAEEDRLKWEKLLGKYGINIRHSSVELNWQIKDGYTSALKLKKYLIKKLDKSDVRTFGLSFAIRSSYMNISSSVIIDKRIVSSGIAGKSKALYDLSYSEGFNRNNQNYTSFATNVPKILLKDKIVELCRYYFEQLNNEPVSETQTFKEEREKQVVRSVHQCRHCLSIYDDKFGDELIGIPAGTMFNDLPESFSCPVCENPKTDFIVKELSMVYK